VLGSYAGTLSSETLTTSNRNKGAELATLKGKRLIIAAETEEGARLSSGMVKQLTSTDKIHAERKYKDPEDFTPSHTIALYTNHLPRVGSTDSGTWRRLVVAPFLAKIEANQEVKNYADTLAREAGGSILSWIIEGAKQFISDGHKITVPAIVEVATRQYQQDNDWMRAFLDECCEIGIGKVAGAGELYEAYRSWADRTGEYKRHLKDFKTELEKKGFSSHTTKKRTEWLGICLERKSYCVG